MLAHLGIAEQTARSIFAGGKKSKTKVRNGASSGATTPAVPPAAPVAGASGAAGSSRMADASLAGPSISLPEGGSERERCYQCGLRVVVLSPVEVESLKAAQPRADFDAHSMQPLTIERGTDMSDRSAQLLARTRELEVKSLEFEQKVQQLLARNRDLEIQLRAHKMAQPLIFVGESEGGRWCAAGLLLAPGDADARTSGDILIVASGHVSTRPSGTVRMRLNCACACVPLRVC